MVYIEAPSTSECHRGVTFLDSQLRILRFTSMDGLITNSEFQGLSLSTASLVYICLESKPIFLAINCTSEPFLVRNNDMGMFNWTGIDGVDPRPYATAIR